MGYVRLPELLQDNGQNTAVASGTFTVKKADGTLATVYSDEVGTIANTLGQATWVRGEAQHCVATGEVYVVIDGKGNEHEFPAASPQEQASLPVNVKVPRGPFVGAVGDGVANDTAIIAAAIALGRPLYFPAGTYLIDGAIKPTNAQLWYGDGMGVSILKLKNGGNTNVVTGDNRSKFTLRDLTIDANQANQTAGSCFTGANMTDFTLLRVELANGWNAGAIVDTGSARFRISDCYVHDNGNAGSFALSGSHGIALSGTTGVPQSGPANGTIKGNLIIDNYGGGVNASQCTYTAITGNSITRAPAKNNSTGYAGVRLSNGARGMTVAGNSILNYSRGVFATEDSGSGSSWYNVISGNYIEGAWLQGILISCSYLVVTGNTIKDCCVGGTPDGAIRAAVVGTESIVHVAITDNVIVDTVGTLHQYGIRTTDVTGTCDYFTVTGNTIKGFTTDALIVGGQNSIVANNSNTQSVDRPSSATLTLRDTSDFFRITGTTAVTAIATSAQRAGRQVTLYAVTGFTLTQGATIKLSGSVNFVMAAGATVTLAWVPTTGAWVETGRLVP